MEVLEQNSDHLFFKLDYYHPLPTSTYEKCMEIARLENAWKPPRPK